MDIDGGGKARETSKAAHAPLATDALVVADTLEGMQGGGNWAVICGNSDNKWLCSCALLGTLLTVGWLPGECVVSGFFQIYSHLDHQEAMWPEQILGGLPAWSGDTETLNVCVFHREAENTISVDRPVVSGEALRCETIWGGRGGREHHIPTGHVVVGRVGISKGRLTCRAEGK